MYHNRISVSFRLCVIKCVDVLEISAAEYFCKDNLSSVIITTTRSLYSVTRMVNTAIPTDKVMTKYSWTLLLIVVSMSLLVVLTTMPELVATQWTGGYGGRQRTTNGARRHWLRFW